jgi:hypothetical protein
MIGAHRDPKGGYVMRRDEKPLRQSQPSGKVRFVARYTARTGKRLSAGTFEKEGPCKRPADDGSCCASTGSGGRTRQTCPRWSARPRSANTSRGPGCNATRGSSGPRRLPGRVTAGSWTVNDRAALAFGDLAMPRSGPGTSTTSWT